MAEYEDSIIIKRWPDEIFQFVTNLNNLPKYLPSPYKERYKGAKHYQMIGAAISQSKLSQDIISHNTKLGLGSSLDNTEGWCRIDSTEYIMEWAAGSDSNYSGWLQIEELDGESEVILHINYTPDPEISRSMIEHEGSVSMAMQKYLAESLHAIKNNIEHPEQIAGI